MLLATTQTQRVQIVRLAQRHLATTVAVVVAPSSLAAVGELMASTTTTARAEDQSVAVTVAAGVGCLEQPVVVVAVAVVGRQQVATQATKVAIFRPIV